MKFDSGRLIDIRIAHPEGDRKITVRWPTDEEWCEYSSRRQVLIRQLGPAETETEVSGAEDAALELLKRIQQEGPELDKYEAAWVVERLSRAQVTDVRREDDAIVVEMRVPGGMVAHRLRVPTLAEVAAYRRSFARLIDRRGGRQLLRVNLSASGQLYDKVAVGTEGYESPAPIIHKAAAISELLAFLEEESGLGEA